MTRVLNGEVGRPSRWRIDHARKAMTIDIPIPLMKDAVIALMSRWSHSNRGEMIPWWSPLAMRAPSAPYTLPRVARNAGRRSNNPG